jgi:hypothetical protein
MYCELSDLVIYDYEVIHCSEFSLIIVLLSAYVTRWRVSLVLIYDLFIYDLLNCPGFSLCYKMASLSCTDKRSVHL